MAYTTQAKVEAYLATSLPAAIAAQFATIAAAAKLWIDRYVGRTFEGASGTRYYEGSDSNRLLVDTFYGTPSAVSVLDTQGDTAFSLDEGDGNDYIVGPFNEDGKYELILTGNGVISRWGRSAKRVAVTATFGQSAAVPADVELAATILAADFCAKATAPDGTLQSVTLGDYSATYADVSKAAESPELGLTVAGILDGYREIPI